MKTIFAIAVIGIVLVIMPTTQIYACAMMAVVCQNTTTLATPGVDFGAGNSGESGWLYQQGNNNPHGHGMVYYHRAGFGGHNNKLLQYIPPIDTFANGSSNHIYRKAGSLGHILNLPIYQRFIGSAKSNQGKIFMGHVRYRSDGPLGAYAPFVYRHIHIEEGQPADTTDFSFAHHGTVDKQAMYDNFGFRYWLAEYDYKNLLAGNPTYYSIADSLDNYVDSDYLFLWLVKHIEDSGGVVKSGLVNGITALRSYSISGRKNFLFSDGSGVYAYTDSDVLSHKMSYKSVQTVYHYIRSYDDIETGWTAIDPHHLYHFPTQGSREITYYADNGVPLIVDLKRGLNWISFPVIDTSNGFDPDYTLRDVNPYANNLQTKNGTQLQPPWYIDDETHSWPAYATLSRTNGYILDLDSTYVEYEYMTVGQRTPYNTSLSLYQSNDNWVPYFILYSQTPADAFGNYFPYVTAIYAQDWYIYKFKGQWYGYFQQGATGTLDYGKMYKVYVSQTLSEFRWTAFGESERFVKEAVSYFEYEEKPDYQAVIIESIPDVPIFNEIGVFKDGECVGALKFDGYPLNLQVYDNSSPDEYDYVLYSESKINNQAERKYTSSTVAISNRVIDNGKHLFSIVSLTGGQEHVTDVHPDLSAMIYPNPMRGNTNIEIKARAKSVVEIGIYNLKGQLVRNINSIEISKGNTSIIWDGRSDDGRSVAKGIYFCRIKSPNNTLTKKLVVLD